MSSAQTALLLELDKRNKTKYYKLQHETIPNIPQHEKCAERRRKWRRLT